MAIEEQSTFFIKLERNESGTSGVTIAPNVEGLQEKQESATIGTDANREKDPDVLTFGDVIRSFTSTIDLYRKFIPLNMALMPKIFMAIIDQGMIPMLEKNGVLRTDLSNDVERIFEVDNRFYQRFKRLSDDLKTSKEGIRLLPEILITGLISSYDFFLSQIICVVLATHPEIVLTADKSIKLSDLKKYGSIMEAQASIIDREIESVMRDSHHEQFSWMQQKFSIPLRANLAIWPSFIELCERRNLLTHTGGIVSHQYLHNCIQHGVAPRDLKVGDKLDIDPSYYGNSVKIIYEMTIKLGHVLWRKFLPTEREQADQALVHVTYTLILQEEYELAEALLRFGTETLKGHSTDAVRRTLVVNLANVLKLRGDLNACKRLLQKEDWSASNDRFAVCVAAVLNDLEKVLELMGGIGKSGLVTAEDFREWPVFIECRKDTRFRDKFRDIFSEEIRSDRSLQVKAEKDGGETELESTLH